MTSVALCGTLHASDGKTYKNTVVGGKTMPEVRTNLPDELHRSLKEEAAREGLHLKKLIAIILEEHIHNNSKQGGVKRGG